MVIVTAMWWRAFAVVVVLLAAGVAGGYAVADRAAESPSHSSTLEPVPAVSPAVPTPPALDILPDPDTPALEPNLPSHEATLRTAKRHGLALVVLEPDGWERNRLTGSNRWTYAVKGNPINTYVLRIDIVEGLHQSITVAKDARIAALQDAVANGALSNLEIVANTDDTLIATYVDRGYLRVTMERWVSFDGSQAFAVAAVTGRTIDQEGLTDLLVRTTASMRRG